jgi:hypothetical protein
MIGAHIAALAENWTASTFAGGAYYKDGGVMSTAVALKKEASSTLSYGILNPQTLDEAIRVAEIMAKSSLVPKDFQGSSGNILIAMQWGMELGLAPLQAMQSIAVINGRPSLWGDAVIAIARSAASCEYITETVEGEGERMVATCRAKRRNQPEEVRTFSVADAQQAGLWGKVGPWKTNPKRMLQMRARSFALRDVFADSLRGMAVAEEQQDIAEMNRERDVTPAKPAEPVRQAIAAYPQDEFEKNFPKWEAIIKSEKKDAQALIDMVGTKGQLSAEQIAKIRAVESGVEQ